MTGSRLNELLNMKRSLRSASVLAALLLPLSAASVSAGGACCSVANAGSDKATFTLVGASAMNHEVVGPDTYKMDQQALILKLGKPVGRGFVLQAQAGLPAATKLSHGAMELSGKGGLIYGIGIGYKLPSFIEPITLSASAGYSRALGKLDRDEAGAVDQSFRINEFQFLFIGEAALTSKTALYGGLRAYSGKNQLEDNKTGRKFNGDQEGSIAGLAGLRHSLSDNFSLLADAGFGHTKVLGLGAVFSF